MNYYLIMDLIIGTKYCRFLLFRLQNRYKKIVDTGQKDFFMQSQRNKEKPDHPHKFCIYLKIVEWS